MLFIRLKSFFNHFPLTFLHRSLFRIQWLLPLKLVSHVHLSRHVIFIPLFTFFLTTDHFLNHVFFALVLYSFKHFVFLIDVAYCVSIMFCEDSGQFKSPFSDQKNKIGTHTLLENHLIHGIFDEDHLLG